MPDTDERFEAEKYRDDLVRLGLHKTAHLDETLVDHMFRACSIVTDMRAEDHVRLAALFHGVYGTEGLHNDNVESIPDEKRVEVRAIVGPVVENMIFTFSVMSYASLGKSFRKVLRPNGLPEIKDRRTGADIPMSADEFEDILRLKLGDVLAHMPQQVSHSHLNLPAEYSGFWSMAAEYLGPDEHNTWKTMTEGKL
jgi:hypothetical protein